MEFAELVERSRALPYGFPTQANRLEAQRERAGEVEEHAAGVRPLLHGDVPALLREFLQLKRALGSPVERALYADLDEVGLVSRLLACRPLAFLGAADSFLLRDGTRGAGGFEAVGTERQREPLTLERVLSYDEMALSALVGVSVPTHFVNAGARSNRARPGAPGSFEPRGVYVGLVGARFERPERMEGRHLLVTRSNNTAARGYGPDADPADPAARLLRAWARFYGREHLPTFEEAAADAAGRYLPAWEGVLLDAELYRRRLRASIAPFLRDADQRAAAAGRRAYVHVVGLGLGVWRIHPAQPRLLVEACAEALREAPLPHLADLDFSWFDQVDACGGARHGELLRTDGAEVRVHFSKRDPAAPLTGDPAGKLLVAMYAWDSHAFPGNEYWMGSLAASGDPAAACCSNIAELQNPDVNPRVSGACAVVAPAGGGLIPLAEVARRLAEPRRGEP